jgi:hypothetical protein
MYFVHGLGGHAYKAWASDITGHMWPRESLPERSEKVGRRGRFITIGYDAKVLSGTKPKTIETAAEEVLNHIRSDRPEVCIPIETAVHFGY